MKLFTKENVRLKQKLQEILEDEPTYESTLTKEVCQRALNNNYGIKDFFSHLLTHGCVSGGIDGLIYYVDTHKFYDKHYDEIEELRDEMEGNLGQPLQIKGDLKNWFAWFGFEEIAYKLANEIGLEI